MTNTGNINNFSAGLAKKNYNFASVYEIVLVAFFSYDGTNSLYDVHAVELKSVGCLQKIPSSSTAHNHTWLKQDFRERGLDPRPLL